MGFAITPNAPLAPGEYILVDTTQDSVNSYGDIKAYDFSVKKNKEKIKKHIILFAD